MERPLQRAQTTTTTAPQIFPYRRNTTSNCVDIAFSNSKKRPLQASVFVVLYPEFFSDSYNFSKNQILEVLVETILQILLIFFM